MSGQTITSDAEQPTIQRAKYLFGVVGDQDTPGFVDTYCGKLHSVKSLKACEGCVAAMRCANKIRRAYDDGLITDAETDWDTDKLDEMYDSDYYE